MKCFSISNKVFFDYLISIDVGKLIFWVCIYGYCFSHEVRAQVFETKNFHGNLEEYQKGNGVAVADFDQDNDLDVFIVSRQDFDKTGESRASRLFKNNGDGTFTDVTRFAGIKSFYDYTGISFSFITGAKLGASWGDYDNDGYPDLFLTSLYHNELYHNNGNSTFSLVTEAAGFESLNQCYNSGANWFDYNNDGWLDVFITKWGECANNSLYRNNGDGTFQEITDGTKTGGRDQGSSWMSIPLDVNQDGWMDLYIANDFDESNELYVNNLGQFFREEAFDYQVDDGTKDGMGLAIGDYNNDGFFDLYVTNIDESSFYEATGNGSFTERGIQLGVDTSGWAWGTNFSDLDNDGDEDLIVLNGFGKPEHNQVYRNTLNEGNVGFIKFDSDESGMNEISESNSVAVFDSEGDGDLDMIISNTNRAVFYYENTTSDQANLNDRNWIEVKLVGTTSNRDGIGTVLELKTSENVQHRLSHGVGFLSQSLLPIHFGLGSESSIDELVIKWPSGLEERYINLTTNKILEFTEGEGYLPIEPDNSIIRGCTDPNSCNYNPRANEDDGSCDQLEVFDIVGNKVTQSFRSQVYSYPSSDDSEYLWFVTNGEIISGQESRSITVRWGGVGQGKVRVQEFQGCASSKSVELFVTVNPKENSGRSVARLWNEELLDAIRNEEKRSPIHARNLFHTSIAMYDSWAVYDAHSRTYLLGNELGNYINDFENFETNIETEEARAMTLSFAVYRLLKHRYKNSILQSNFDDLMTSLSYDIGFTSSNYSSGDPAALGNYIASSIINFGLSDGAREIFNYDNTSYEFTNDPLDPRESGNNKVLDPNKWQAINMSNESAADESNSSSKPLNFMGFHWNEVSPFALNSEMSMVRERDGINYKVFFNPMDILFLDTLEHTDSNELYKWNFSTVAKWSSVLTSDDDEMWDISPNGFGNIQTDSYPKDFSDCQDFYESLGNGNFGIGRSQNPIAGNTYTSQFVPRGDYTRVAAEYWSNGPNHETPPGHWYYILNSVSDDETFEKKIEGTGMELNDLEWDVKSYFTLGGALHDAAIATWSAKSYNDFINPISAIRYFADKGQSSDPSLPNYNINGIPFETDFLELVNSEDNLVGDNLENFGKIKIRTSMGSAEAGWILLENWWPYIRSYYENPQYSSYVSEYSAFSRAGSEVMARLTGSEFFPNGLGQFSVDKDRFLTSSVGPSQDIILQWATYRDASDECGFSQIWAGTYSPIDDMVGKEIGEKAGINAFEYAKNHFQHEVTSVQAGLEENEMVLFPNPVGNDYRINISKIESHQSFEVYDLNGRSVRIKSIHYNFSNSTATLELDRLSRGMYVLRTAKRSLKFLVK
ncbi:MAG: VCBS repeat-containing protein [Reichenbachiella sp.]